MDAIGPRTESEKVLASCMAFIIVATLLYFLDECSGEPAQAKDFMEPEKATLLSQ